jgi:ubiquinone/menaquinone biosynthesis C-methylase UbiE
MQQAPDLFNEHGIVEYYENTSLDYGSWSRDYNMHFGYWRRGLNPLRREPMLQEMNRLVINHLPVPMHEDNIYDLGCGLGATMRTFARQYPKHRITGFTLVPWQVEMANKINAEAGLDDRISVVQGNYLDLPLHDRTASSAYALESCCHSPGEDKAAFLEETYRILKPGGRSVIVDGFTKVPRNEFSKLFEFCHDQTCKGWALPCFPSLSPFLTKMKALGFEKITAKDISMRIAPSALHSPFCVAGFIFQKWWQGEKLNSVRVGHLKSCLLGLLLGISRRQFGYHIICAQKRNPAD